MTRLPLSYTKKMKDLLGEDYSAYEATFSCAPSRGFLINAAKIGAAKFDEIFSLPTRPVPYFEFGRILDSEEKVGGDPYHAAGLFYMQDPGAMSAIAALPSFGKKILDVAAAPGGKTIGAAIASPDSLIVANEIDFKRAKILLQNVERLGLKNVAVTSLTPKDLGKYAKECFDLVICDLPCSGEGMFRKEPAAIECWNEGINGMNAARQKEILTDVLPCLKEGGTLLYSTCTYAVEEDEAIVDFLAGEKGLTPISPKSSVLPYTAPAAYGYPSASLARRFYPHIAEGEGQFFAILKKEGDKLYTQKTIPSSLSANEIKKIRAFTDENIDGDVGDLAKNGDSIFAVHPLARTIPLKYLSEGVCLGEFVKGRFEPHHNLFTAFGADFKNKEDLALSDKRVKEYLYGLEIEAKTAKEGYCAVCVEGFPLGGGKVVNGTIKNKYPKGLRIPKL